MCCLLPTGTVCVLMGFSFLYLQISTSLMEQTGTVSNDITQLHQVFTFIIMHECVVTFLHLIVYRLVFWLFKFWKWYKNWSVYILCHAVIVVRSHLSSSGHNGQQPQGIEPSGANLLHIMYLKSKISAEMKWLKQRWIPNLYLLYENIILCADYWLVTIYQGKIEWSPTGS